MSCSHAVSTGNVQTVADLLLNTPQEIAKRCKTSPLEIKRITNAVLNAIPLHKLNILESVAHDGDEKFSTGDVILDNALEGGMRTGMVWEIVGERYVLAYKTRLYMYALNNSPSSSGAGKTQLALQLSLFVQGPKEMGGLAGSACYLTTSSKLPTARLLQISESNELLSPSICSMEDIHTISIPTSDFFQLVLTTILPSFIQDQQTIQGKKPVKLVIIDALAELFHDMGKTTTNALVERKQNIAKISARLHEIASSYNLAIVVLNEVVDNFDQEYPGSRVPGEMTYKQQSHAGGFDEKKKAALGPAWTNQVNARIMLSRTGRRKHLQNEFDFPQKRRQSSDNQHQLTRASIDNNQEPTLIRRLRIVFSPVSAPASLDFIVSERGISILQDNTHTALVSDQTSKHTSDQHPKGPSAEMQLETTSARFVTHEAVAAADIEDEYDKLWTEDTYNDFDWDALEQALTQTA